MQSFLQFVFQFLYVRNWHTGERELSRSRVFLWSMILFLVLLALTLIMFLQAPVEGANPPLGQT
jgi:hypothetical protein